MAKEKLKAFFEMFDEELKNEWQKKLDDVEKTIKVLARKQNMSEHDTRMFYGGVVWGFTYFRVWLEKRMGVKKRGEKGRIEERGGQDNIPEG